MRTNRMMTSLVAMGGLALAVMQMLRMRTRPRGWRRLLSRLDHSMNEMMSGANRMMNGRMLRTMRRRAR